MTSSKIKDACPIRSSKLDQGTGRIVLNPELNNTSYYVRRDGVVVVTQPGILKNLDALSQLAVKALEKTGDIVIEGVCR